MWNLRPECHQFRPNAGDQAQRVGMAIFDFNPDLRREARFAGVLLAANLLFDAALFPALGWVDKLLVSRGAIAVGPTSLIWVRFAEGFILGCCFSQIVVVAIGTALFSGSNLLRILVGTLILACSVCALVAETTIFPFHNLRPRRDTFELSGIMADWLFVIIAFYCVQIPFWILRGMMQLRITNARTEPSWSQANHQLSLLQILGMTAYLAVPMALLSGVTPVYGAREYRLLVIALPLTSIAFGLPYLGAIMSIKRIVWAVAALVAMSEVLVFSGSQLFCRLESIRPVDWPFVAVAFRGGQLATLLVTIANGLAARAVGYRLRATLPGKIRV
jgi:hypothetical protein